MRPTVAPLEQSRHQNPLDNRNSALLGRAFHTGASRRERVSATHPRPALWLGAKLGAIRVGPLRSCVDTGGIGSQLLSHVRTDVDVHGRRLEIYGSGGWVFESPRARRERPCTSRGSHVSRAR
jgi:hypothetical protein